ncbi:MULTISPECIES: hypothetical protein [Pseudomonas]|uniref:Secreted protein n=3 Tax=Pseudomonas TaxID=286 RepID=A0A3G1DGQ4_PSEAI|nr:MULTISPECIES: hypothetical protein [Pseudomonas]AXQ51171.1 hypothetical protein DZC31_31355 [Stenotrophomonas rhizophila]MCO6692538.1 hypothetical protein [Pseudomonas shirazica]AMP35836.1 Hypothetical protein [Pseudomonas aeruginosa]KIC79788.1 hypothetical protein RR51_24680 [Pseudomonas sp. C5pp]MCE0853337.1 hypothetical protein [Pseudomonas asiatica]
MKLWYTIAAAVAFLGLAHAANASEASAAVLSVATSKMSSVARINGATRPVIYVGQFDGCDSVSIQNAPGRYEHFRVCGNQVTARNTVSPSWAEDDGAGDVLRAVVDNAVLFGAASQVDPNGYLITARALGSAQYSCTNVEVILSYEGDLVDRALKSICSHRR